MVGISLRCTVVIIDPRKVGFMELVEQRLHYYVRKTSFDATFDEAKDVCCAFIRGILEFSPFVFHIVALSCVCCV